MRFRSLTVRRLAAVLFALVFTTSTLTACAGTASGPQPGSASNAVHLEGEFGTNPSIKIDSPASADEVQCTTVIAGKGDRAGLGQMITVDVGIYNGTNGELIQSTSFDGSDTQDFVIQEGLLPGLVTGFTCVTEGSRVVIAVPPADAFGETGNTELGIAGTDTLLFVVDTHHVYLAKASGSKQDPEDGMPTVTLDSTGKPSVTIPTGTAPTEQGISTLIAGKGAKVASGDNVVVHYSGYLWSDGTQFDSSWENGSPTRFMVGDGVEITGEVIQGFSNAIIGQTVGSQIVTVIPPELGYGAEEKTTIPANSTLVFVIDILGIAD